jgi:hypothetical protein
VCCLGHPRSSKRWPPLCKDACLLSTSRYLSFLHTSHCLGGVHIQPLGIDACARTAHSPRECHPAQTMTTRRGRVIDAALKQKTRERQGLVDASKGYFQAGLDGLAGVEGDGAGPTKRARQQ